MLNVNFKMYGILLRAVLVMGLALPPQFILQSSPVYAIDVAEPTPYDSFISQISRSGEVPEIRDNFHLNEHGQVHRIYKFENGKTILVKEVDLGGGANGANEMVPVANFDREVRVVYDANHKELQFQRFIYNKDIKKNVVTNVHAITNIDLQTSEGQHVLVDNNIVLFEAEDGKRVILKAQFIDLMFKAKLPMFTVTPSITRLVEGSKIKEISFFTPEEEPRELVESSGSRAGQIAETAGAYDIMTRLELSDGREVNVKTSYRYDILRSLSIRMPYLLAQVALADPKPETLNQINEILQDYEEFQGVNEMARSMIISTDENPASDLSDSALMQLAQVIDRERLMDLTRQSNGQNQLAKLQDALWDEYGLAHEWPLVNKAIKERQQQDTSGESRTWREHLIAEMTNQTDQEEKVMAEAASVMEKNEKRIFKKILSRVRMVATPGRMAALSSAIAGDLWNQTTEGLLSIWMLAFTAMTFDIASIIPGVSGITSKIMESGSYFMHTDLAFVKLMVGALLILNFRNISYFLSNMWARAKGAKWSSVQAFFTAGARLFARASYPIQKRMWEGVLNQRNLYGSAVLEGRSTNYSNLVRQEAANILDNIPFLRDTGVVRNWVEDQRNQPTAFNAVFPQWVKQVPGIRDIPYVRNWTDRHDQQMERNKGNIDRVAKEDAIRRQRALLMAAVIVSERMRQEGTPMDPANLIMLFEADKSIQMDRYIEAVNSAPPEVQWNSLVQELYRGLENLSDKGISKEEVLDVAEYYKLLRAKSKKLNRKLNRHPKIQALTGWMQKKWNSFVTFTSKDVIPFILYSPQGYELYMRYKASEINERNSNSASHQFNEDYVFSTYYYAATDSKNFGAIAELDPRASGEVISNQLEQIFIYGLKAGVEYDQVSFESIELDHPAEPISNATVLRAKSPENGGIGRIQTPDEGIKEIFTQLLTPNSRRSILGSHMGRMSVQTRGLQVNFLAGALPKAVALMIASLAVGAAFTEAGIEASKAASMQLNILFNKLAVFTNGNGGLAMGYAVIWAAIIYIQNVIKDKAEVDLDNLSGIDTLFDRGIRWESENHWREAVIKILDLYEKDGQTLPSQFNIDPSKYSLELARDLSLYSIENPPVATVASEGIQKYMNQLGALVSTVLFVAISNDMWDPDADVTSQMIKSIGFFGLTYAIALQAKSVTDNVLTKGHQIKNYCDELMIKYRGY